MENIPPSFSQKDDHVFKRQGIILASIFISLLAVLLLVVVFFIFLRHPGSTTGVACIGELNAEPLDGALTDDFLGMNPDFMSEDALLEGSRNGGSPELEYRGREAEKFASDEKFFLALENIFHNTENSLRDANLYYERFLVSKNTYLIEGGSNMLSDWIESCVKNPAEKIKEQEKIKADCFEYSMKERSDKTGYDNCLAVHLEKTACSASWTNADVARSKELVSCADAYVENKKAEEKKMWDTKLRESGVNPEDYYNEGNPPDNSLSQLPDENFAKAKGRDAKRVSDIKNLQSALELYLDSCGRYPAVSGVVDIGVGLRTTMATGCPDDVSLGTFIGELPRNPTPGGINYTYKGDKDGYELRFKLEEGVSENIGAGMHTATQNGIQ